MKAIACAVIPLAILASCKSAERPEPPSVHAQQDCAVGYYSMPEGDGVDIGYAADNDLRWRRPDGRSGLLQHESGTRWTSTVGWTGRADGITVDLAACDEGQIRFGAKSVHRQVLDEQPMVFESAGAELAGRLVLPVSEGPVPLVILVHGSEDLSALRYYALQRLLPAQGVGVLVYDKRGTGASEGTYTHDINQLAADVAAATEAAREAAPDRISRIGYYGTSQGGWVAPLAARSTGVDFVIVGYGLAVSPMDEDNEALVLDMTRHGFGKPAIAGALDIGRAAQAILRSNFETGYDDLRTTLARYENEPWYPYIRGNITGIIIGTPEDTLREIGPKLLNGAIPDYDPMPTLRALDVPQLWILGAQDIDAPYAETFRRLQSLQGSGKPIGIVVYPQAEHGLYEFEEVEGERLSTRQPSSLLDLLISYARGEGLGPAKADASVYP